MKPNNQILRMQQLAGLITESEGQQAINAAEKIENAVVKNDKLEQKIENLTPEQISQLKKVLTNLGVTPDSSVEDIADKIAPKIEEIVNENEDDTKKKVASVLSDIGGGIVKSLMVPVLPVIVGNVTDTGFAGGFAITFGVAGALIGLAKLLGETENSSEFGNN